MNAIIHSDGLTIHIRRNHFCGVRNAETTTMSNEDEKDFLMCICMHEYWFEEKKVSERKENFIIKWMELNINGKFEEKSNMQIWKCSLTRKRFHIALHGFILLLPKCEYLFYFKSSSLSRVRPMGVGRPAKNDEGNFSFNVKHFMKIISMRKPHRHFLFICYHII